MEKHDSRRSRLWPPYKSKSTVFQSKRFLEYIISEVTFYYWKSKYGGIESSDVKQFKDLQEENAWLKRMFAEFITDQSVLKDVITKKAGALQAKGTDGVYC